MKKLIAAILSVTMLLALCACTSSEKPVEPERNGMEVSDEIPVIEGDVLEITEAE